MKLGHRYECDICGTVAPWSEGWVYHGSISLMEMCPGELPMACSAKCEKSLQGKIDSGEFKVPRITMKHGAPRQTRDRQGY